MLYQEISVWERVDDNSAILYRGLVNQSNGKYSVQSADCYRLPLEKKQIDAMQAQFVELFIESDPVERAGAFDSLEEAIAAHRQKFDASG